MINDLSKRIHQANVQKGFYEDKNKNIPEILCLIHSEVSEALEAHRKGNHSDSNVIKQLSESKDKENIVNVAFEEIFKEHIKDTFEDEIADAIIRLLDLCGFLDINIESHIEAKLRYNSTRPFKHGKKY